MRSIYIIGGIIVIVCIAFLVIIYNSELLAFKDNAEGYLKNVSSGSEEVIETISKGEEQRVILGIIKIKYDDGTCLALVGNDKITCKTDNAYLLDDKSVGDNVRIHVYHRVEGDDVVTDYYIEE